MTKIGRNDPCPCGSGKKYKVCCMLTDQTEELQSYNKTKSNGALRINQERDGHETNFELLQSYHEKLMDLSDEEYEEYMSEFEDDDDFDNILDDLTEEQVIIVDDWWDRFYELDNTPEMREHINTFLVDHPDLIPYLELYAEPLSRLAESYLESNQFDQYINFIRQLTKTHPQEILNGGGSIEKDIITWLLAKDRYSEISEFLKMFQSHPLDYANELPHVVNVFLLLNKTKYILPVLDSIYEEICASEDLIEPYSLLHPIIAQQIDKNFAHFNPYDMLDFLENELSVELDEEVLEISFWETYIDTVKRPFEKWPEIKPDDDLEAVDLCRRVCENYMRFLKEKLGLHFATAEYLAFRVDRYLLEFLDNHPSSKKIFNFSYGRMRKAIESVAGGYIWLDFVQLMSILNGLYYFADYLQECGNLSPNQVLKIKSDLEKIHTSYIEEGLDNELDTMLFQDFPIIY